ncbi:hypothetical protein [Proteiniphilum acetatigenes]|uniref:hypothetical protein n=1 Tax=Proteiniphilum acetatigenes TaxID=294710 RepID=UPI000369701A|nr:hypothetical protein [Proteiniphilum acetatigenes]
MKILLIVSLIIILLLYNCQRPVEKTKCNHDKFIHEYAEENFDSDTFIVNFDYIFFANIGSDSIMITDNVSLYEIYKSQYIDKFSDFKIFLCSLYDDKTILKKEDIDNNIEKVNKIIFRKETLIIDSLSHENVDKIRDYYFTNDDFFRTNIEQ